MPILSVSQINRFIKQSLSEIPQLKNLYISGEISNYKRHYQSGHIYFTLKDAQSQLACVMFRSYAERMRFQPESGMKVLCRGTIDMYENSGQVQLYVYDMQPQGIGALQLAFEQLKEKLQKQGIFDEAHKKPIPKYPRVIGVATSDTGAAVEDIKNILGRRFPLCEVVLVPTVVQGASAPGDIVRSLSVLDTMPEVDTIIVGRGGGSLEDLAAFNSEAVAMAVYHCHTPVISAVGHETDFTICDFAADLRAPTPSAAAELAVPDWREELMKLGAAKEALQQLLQNRLSREAQRLLRLKEASVLSDVDAYLSSASDRINEKEQRMTMRYRTLLMHKEKLLGERAASLNALSPLAVLGRGYSVTRCNGAVVSSVRQLTKDDTVEIVLSDGSVKATVTEVNTNEG